MIVFELSMPNKGSWNGKWSQEGQLFVRVIREYDVPKEYWNKSFYYMWDDGWTACVTTTRMTANKARKLERKSKGFCDYDWMIRSIIKYGDIRDEGGVKNMSDYNWPKQPPIQGWQCPICGKVMSPTTPFCPCNGQGGTTITSTGTTVDTVRWQYRPTTTTADMRGE